MHTVRQVLALSVLALTGVLCLATSAEPTCRYIADAELELDLTDGSATLRVESEGNDLTLAFDRSVRLELPDGALPSSWQSPEWNEYEFENADERGGVVFTNCPANFDANSGPLGQGGASASEIPLGGCSAQFLHQGTFELLVIPLQGDARTVVTAEAGIESGCEEQQVHGQYGVHLEQVEP